MSKMIMRRLVASAMATSMVLAVIPQIVGNGNVSASEQETKTKTEANTCLSTSKMASPAKPTEKSYWSGSYVYFSNLDGDWLDVPSKYRVLAPKTNAYGGTTMFIDCELGGYSANFDDDTIPNEGATYVSEWEFSDLKKGLNGDKFLNRKGVFTEAEKKAIANSYSQEHELVASDTEEAGKVLYTTKNNYSYHVPLKGEKIFVLDAEELSNIDYGYNMIAGPRAENNYKMEPGYARIKRVKRNPENPDSDYGYYSCWIRSFNSSSPDWGNEADVEGIFCSCPITGNRCAKPAMNIDLSYVLFSTLLSGKFNKVGAEYKLTIKDEAITAAVPSGEKVTSDGSSITVPYVISGDNAEQVTRMSYMITDKAYDDSDANLLYYNELEGDFSLTGASGSFALPSDLDISRWGSDYHVYIFAEILCDGNETDYASEPLELTKPSAVQTEYKVTVNNDEGVTGTASIAKGTKGTKVTLKASVKEGYQFKGWQVVSGDVTLADAKKNTTTFTIGSKDVVIKASAAKTNVPDPTKAPTVTPTEVPSDVVLTLNKDSVKVTCGKTTTLKATVEGSDSAVTWESSDKKVATVNSKGEITAKQAGQAAIKATVDGVTATCTVTVLYKDVTDPKDFWYNPTNYLTAAGVVKGYDKQTKFKPGNDCTRAQMVTFLWRLQGEPAPKSSTCKFKDVKKDDYFFKPVIWAVENGITTGVSKTKFNPQGVCTRAQTVTFLWRMADKPDPKSTMNKFKDVKKKDYFYKPVLWASEQKIVAGYKDGTFKPQGKCLRRQMVTFLYKYDKFVNGKG
ncbi:MAG: S-layer homology domain-containing protein [Clostridiales bacterium]|nr:S-layer homology domain-containing protein [Clostridiales bacterium]